MPIKDTAARNAYMRDYYAKNSEVHKARVKVTKDEARRRNKVITREARQVPCADCGQQYPHYVMQFDHLGEDKTDNVTTMANSGVSEARLLAEMAKCEVVCANCHCERTAQRGGWAQE